MVYGNPPHIHRNGLRRLRDSAHSGGSWLTDRERLNSEMFIISHQKGGLCLAMDNVTGDKSGDKLGDKSGGDKLGDKFRETSF